ncbi:unnamed protein product [Caenorhabditis nigoni]
MRSPICNVVPGQLGWMGSDQFYKDYDNHRDSRRIGKEDDVGCQILERIGCSQLPGSFGYATHCYFFYFRRLIEVIEVKKVLKGLRSPMFGVHG